MTCAMIDEKLIGLTAAGGAPEFTGEEREHIGRCARCAAVVSELEGVGERISAASRVRPPGPEYWASILPRLREKTGPAGASRPAPAIPAFARGILPAAAAIVAAILLSVTGVDPPDRAGADGSIAALNEAELYDLRQAGRNAGLLEPAESNGAAENGISELLAEILSEKGEDALHAIAEPEDLLREVDDRQFAEIVGMLEHR
jgi:hypothetical protein